MPGAELAWHAAGVDATKFTARHRETAWLPADDLSGVGASEGVIIRAAKLDLGPTKAAAETGRDRRVELGLLTGDAAGLTPLAPVDEHALAELAASAGDRGEQDGGDAELPEVLALLADALAEDERGIASTAEMAARIGWDARTLGEALRRSSVSAPRPPRQRVSGAKHPVSVQSIDTIIAAIVDHGGWARTGVPMACAGHRSSRTPLDQRRCMLCGLAGCAGRPAHPANPHNPAVRGRVQRSSGRSQLCTTITLVLGSWPCLTR
ncbi:hypothetical protein [Actinokineospora cianjurensis]|uniref:Uncharacterized protein n=1 Tax=Actinokineospora cianjurensis TaxID=585224 RepID=A0A421AXD0_9PSEU|nr:hypothetical protein [Actinokineospora cianjurensis]RLK54448.1 hypothetical protein CLV68_6000 [Actinokineospora cianjurensis]